jgi:catechol 2,3-dioxygenase-like lactoylglutathione lyase family enzyme
MVELRYAILFVSDLERSIRFYRDVLGLPLLSEERDQADFDAGGGMVVTLHQAHSEAPHHHPPTAVGAVRLGFHVDDLDEAHARVLGASARCINPPEERLGVRLGLYEDPDGFTFTLASGVGVG